MEERTHASADQLPCAWARLDGRGHMVDVNTLLCGWVGRAREALLGQAFDGLLTLPARVLYQTYLQPLLRLHGNVEELSLTLKAADGTHIDVLLYGARVAGTADGSIDLILAPIRTRRRIEDELLRIKRAADQSPGVIFQLLQAADGSEHFPYASESLRTLYGVSPEQARASAEAVFERIVRGDRNRTAATMRRAAHRGDDWRGAYRVRSADGSLRWHEAHATPRRLAQGQTLWHGHAADVTDRRAMESAFAERDAAQRAHRARSEFLARVSHELRTPLNGIIGFVQLLATDQADNLTPLQRDRLGVVRSSGQHLLALINDVLDLTHIETGDLALELHSLAVLPQLEQSQRVVEALALAAGVRLRPIACLPELRASANPRRLHQVLVNLLSNAVKYNRPGGEVRVSAEAVPGGVRIAVADTGIGLSTEQQRGLFQPFNRLGAERGRTEGSGLGLVISQQLLARMGANLGVSSRSGTGSTFTIRLAGGELPSAAVDAPHASNVTAPGSAVGSARGTVLYAEDNPVNAILMEAIVGLRPQLTIRIASDGAAALRDALASPPDLLLLDMNLPDTDGLALLATLRAHESLRAVPAVAVSAAAGAHDIAQARDGGFDAYWTKPLDVAHTLAELDRRLGGRPR